MKKLLFSAILLAFIYVPANADTVRMGTEGAYPPYNFINDNGEIDGFERDLGDELCDRAGLDCEWVQNDWDSIIPNLVLISLLSDSNLWIVFFLKASNICCSSVI